MQNILQCNAIVLSLSHNNKTKNKMNTTELKREIEKLAKEENITFVEACQAMQSAAAKMGSEEMITTIHNIKMESLGL